MKKIIKILFKLSVAAAILGLLFLLSLWLCNKWVISSTNAKIYNDTSTVPAKDVGLLLGTVPTLWNGRDNLYFTYRIRAAADLYKAGKIKHVLVSGDNHKHDYNEPEAMQQALINAGIPESDITLDFAGFRTLDSVVRAKKVFQQESFTVISQEFHNQRAIFIANRYGIEAVGYNAKDVPHAYSKKVRMREFLAKPKAVLDLYILRKKPKFLGKKIDIVVSEAN